MSGAQLMAALQRAGFIHVSQRGSHVKMRRTDGKIVIIPNHKELAQGTMRSILRQAGLSDEDFCKLIDQ
ncbi:type II toxin-antitoxin system HicA family toxin [Alicyclobacillus acidiphilus]|uniref:type II toxin-antitoxin system HicA family toxin n=1 Tax=Alicyclobacillus acidiphilus TaxID=182455 RepID=UPI001C3F16DB|nr:type II toxin-antitoxin system HicA family toxin [Alicyclobacillus acidiphilus]